MSDRQLRDHPATSTPGPSEVGVAANERSALAVALLQFDEAPLDLDLDAVTKLWSEKSKLFNPLQGIIPSGLSGSGIRGRQLAASAVANSGCQTWDATAIVSANRHYCRS